MRPVCSKNGQHHCSERLEDARGDQCDGLAQVERDQTVDYLVWLAKEFSCRVSALKFVCWGFDCCC